MFRQNYKEFKAEITLNNLNKHQLYLLEQIFVLFNKVRKW